MNKILKIDYEYKIIEYNRYGYIPIIKSNINIDTKVYDFILETLSNIIDEKEHLLKYFNIRSKYYRIKKDIVDFNSITINNIIDKIINNYEIYNKFNIFIINIPIYFNNQISNKINYIKYEKDLLKKIKNINIKEKTINLHNKNNYIFFSTFYNILNNEENINFIINKNKNNEIVV